MIELVKIKNGMSDIKTIKYYLLSKTIESADRLQTSGESEKNKSPDTKQNKTNVNPKSCRTK